MHDDYGFDMPHDLMFAPLFKATGKLKLQLMQRDAVMEQYMFMGKDKDGVFYYKHSITRKYVYVREDGTIVTGELDINDYNQQEE